MVNPMKRQQTVVVEQPSSTQLARHAPHTAVRDMCVYIYIYIYIYVYSMSIHTHSRSLSLYIYMYQHKWHPIEKVLGMLQVWARFELRGKSKELKVS